MRLVGVAGIAVAVAATFAAPFFACAQSPPDTPADTIAVSPAVTRLQELLAVMNTGDADAMASYLERNSGDRRLSWMLLPLVHELYRQSTGFDLVRVRTIGAQQFQPQLRGYTAGVLRNRATGNERALVISVEPQPPHRITGLPILHPSLDAMLVQRPAPAALSEAERLLEIGAYVKRLADADAFSGVVVVLRDREPVLSQAHGHADREKRIPNTLSTPFMLGSMNKLFTGLAVGQLVEQGKLSYDDPLSKFIPDYPDRESAKKIRIKHLLSHTSGLLPGFTNRAYYDSLDRLTTVKALVEAGDREPPKFEPGTRWAYSNFGFVLLGRVIEIVTGEDYYDSMAKNVFAPAGMTTTSFPMLPRNGVATVPMAYPYEIEVRDERLQYVNKLGADFRRGGPSCCGVASALDLIALTNALESGRVVKTETLRLHSTPKPELNAPNYGYGFAVGMRAANARPLVGHGGNAPGQCTEYGALKDTPYTIIVLSNLTIGTCVSVAAQIMRVLTTPDHGPAVPGANPDVPQGSRHIPATRSR